MVLTIKHKLVLYRRFEYDIWGYCYTDDKCAFIYNVPQRKYGKTWPLKVLLNNVYKLNSPYISFFFRLWWERRQRYHRRRRVMFIDLMPQCVIDVNANEVYVLLVFV